MLNGYQGFLSPDTLTYVAPAESLLHGHFSVNGIPEIVRTPGYPLFLVAAVATHHWIFFGLLENFCLATASAILVWKIACELFPSSHAGWWALLLYCFEPVGFLYSEKLLSDLLFATELLLFVWLVVRFLRKPGFRPLLCSAAVLGVATYTRPVSLLLGLWLLPFFLLFPGQLSWSKRIARAAAFILTFALMLVPWVIRNFAVAGYRGFSAVTDVNLYFYSDASIKSRLERKGYAQAQRELGFDNQEAYFRLHPEQRDWSQARILQFQGAEGQRMISQHLVLYAKIHLRGCVIVVLDPAATEAMKFLRLYPESGGLIYHATDQGPVQATLWLIQNYPKIVVTLLLLFAQLVLYYLLGLVGLRQLPLAARLLFIVLSIYFVLVSGSSYAVARFRMPIMPLVCIAAGVAIAGYRARSRVNWIAK